MKTMNTKKPTKISNRIEKTMDITVITKIINRIEEILDISFDYNDPKMGKFIFYVKKQYDCLKSIIPSEYSENLINDTANRIAVHILLGLPPFDISQINDAKKTA